MFSSYKFSASKRRSLCLEGGVSKKSSAFSLFHAGVHGETSEPEILSRLSSEKVARHLIECPRMSHLVALYLPHVSFHLIHSYPSSDVESFLCLPFVPEASRGSVIAVRAFNVEVALAADKASDVRIAEMRLRWWLGVVGKKQWFPDLLMSLCNNTLLR